MQQSVSIMLAQLRTRWLKGFVAGVSLLLMSCAGPGVGGKTPEGLVEQRAQQRLDALLARDFDKAMQYTTPAYRSRVDKNQYAKRYLGVVNWTEASVNSVSCHEERCDVKIQVTYEMVRPRIANTRPLDEVWIKVDGEWYIYHK